MNSVNNLLEFRQNLNFGTCQNSHPRFQISSLWDFQTKYIHQKALLVISELNYFEQNPSSLTELDSKIFHMIDERIPPNSCSFLLQVKRKIVALHYRTQQKTRQHTIHDFNKLQKLAENWFKQDRNKIFHRLKIKEEPLKIACGYSEFLDFLDHDFQLQDRFFKWIIPYNLPAEVFIEFPHMQETLEKIPRLMDQLGIHDGKHLNIERLKNNKLSYSDLTIKIARQGNQSILNLDSTVIFSDQKKWSIEQIFNEYIKKPIKIGRLEIFEDGLTEFNVENIESEIDISQVDFWKELPVVKTLTTQQICERYEIPSTDLLKNGSESKWIVAPAASRTKIDLGPQKCHSYIEIAVPHHQNQYILYPFHILADPLPQNEREELKYIAGVFPAKVVYYNGTIDNLDRDHTFIAHPVSEEQGKRSMEAIRLAMQQTHVYQFLIRNCAHFSLKILKAAIGKERVHPRLFKMHYFDMQPSGGFKILYDTIRSVFPLETQRSILRKIHELFAWNAARSGHIQKGQNQKEISLWKDEPWSETGIMYHPAYLHWLKDNETLPAYIEID